MQAFMRRPFSYAGSFLLIGTLIVFFGFHTIAGERGLLERSGLDHEIVMAQEELALLNKQNNLMESRIRLLRVGAIDADMLAETARAQLGLYLENDVIISIDMDKLKF